MTILFTGINGKLGKNFAKNFGQKHKIIGIGSNEKCQAENVHDYINFNLDTDGVQVEALIDYLGDKYRYDHIEGIIHGAVSYYFEELYMTNSKLFESSLNLNVVIPQMINQTMSNRYMGNGGHIIHLGSFAGEGVYLKSMVYSVSKAALNMLMKYEAAEYERFNVKVNMVVPTTFPGLAPTDIVSREVEKLLHTSETGKTVYIANENQIWTK